MPDELRQIIQTPQPEITPTFAAYEATRQFYREVQTREATSLYCDWYYKTATHHRQELQQMRGEFNLMSWFRRKKY